MRPHSAFNGARWPRYHSTKMPQSLSESDALAAQLQVSTLKAANQLKIESSSIEEDNESSLATDASPKAIAVYHSTMTTLILKIEREKTEEEAAGR